jgi:hypothetical protein
MSDYKNTQRSKIYSLLGKVQSAEKLFLSGRRNREADLESAVMFFLEFLRGFESFDFQSRMIPVGLIPSANPTSPTGHLAVVQRVLREDVRWLL